MMNTPTSDSIGAAWLIRHASIELVAPLYVSSSIGGRRQTEPPRYCRRLNILREYNDENTTLHPRD